MGSTCSRSSPMSCVHADSVTGDGCWTTRTSPNRSLGDPTTKLCRRLEASSIQTGFAPITIVSQRHFTDFEGPMKLRDIRSLVNVEAPRPFRCGQTCPDLPQCRRHPQARGQTPSAKRLRLPRRRCRGRSFTAAQPVEFRRLVLRAALGRDRESRSELDGAGQADGAAPRSCRRPGEPGFSTRTANSPLPVRLWQPAFRTDWRT